MYIIFAVSAAEDAVNTSQVYTIPSGETAKLFWLRSDREKLKGFRLYRAWKENVSFAMITKGTLTATCPDNSPLKKFCSSKTEFKIYNETHLILTIKKIAFNNSGNYSVQHVFGGLESNHRDLPVLLRVEGK